MIENLNAINGLHFATNIKSVKILSQSGWFTKSSKGIYSLIIKCDDINKIGEVIGAISDSENISLNELEWVYDEDFEKLSLIQEAMKKCQEKAKAMAEIVGHEISHIHSASDSYDIPNANLTIRRPTLDDWQERRRRGAVAGSSVIDIGTEFKGTKEIIAIASVEYIITPK